ncbi:MAG: DUF4397 domain-containing protein [Gammaproteobacteria bacterium]|nr:MAG: DUF4397 domain-containing protein [Gammaproteobacteria bacterium]
MQTRLMATLLATAALAVAGCNSGSPSSSGTFPPAPPPPPPPPPETSTVRIVHASADAPNVDILVEGDVAFGDVPFLAATPITELDSGDYEIQVDARLPGDERLAVIGPVTLSLEADIQYNVLAIGNVAADADSPEAFGPLILEQPQEQIDAGDVRVRVVHGAPNAPEVNVFVTEPGDLPAGEMPLGTFAFGEDLDPVTVPEGDYQIRVAVEDSGEQIVVFDSGAVTLPGGADLLVTAVPNTGAGDAPVKLLVSDGQSAFTLRDVNTPSNVRVVHASPDAPAVDVIVNDNFEAPFLAGVPFPVASDFVSVEAGEYNVKVTAAGNAGAIVIDADVELPAGAETTVVAVGLLADIDALLLADDRRGIATESRVRIVHGAPSAGEVDVYVTAVGAGIEGVDPAIPAFDFLDDTGYLSLDPGSYDVTVTLAGTDTVAIGPLTIEISAGGVYSAIARDPLPGTDDFGLILLDDFLVEDEGVTEL